ncbi:RING finger protein 10-like [Homarus americanus]|uniref:RING finger protein 10-like n=1 Tax=Homarus americanus TaxID=6706 RepID=UPI001C4555AA|nr:RING finger protein 10-like [Homarus americanus]
MDTTTPSTATTAAMDKNNKVPRLPQLTVKTTSQEAVGREYGGKKSAPQHARKREYDRPDSGRKPVAGRGGRTGQRYVRPREKMGGKVDGGTGTSESGSLYCTGGKKQNITHLMNWWGPGHRSHGNRRGGGAQVKRYSSHAPKYSKEHYLQANCQFVVDDQEDYSLYSANQDLLVEWRFVEEVRLHVSEAPACPICLHPPVAAKVTRCGHIYCFPCVLHYLALSDEKWRKCPICYEPVVKEDLKSVVAICHKEFGIGEEIELQLMRRERDSLVPVPAVLYNEEIMNTATRISHPTAATPYAKLLLASKDEVRSHILMREKRDLEAQLVEEGDQPEACFIDEALSLLRTRQDSLSSDSDVGELLIKAEEGLEAMSLSSPEEPSSGDSVSSVEEPLSLVSPTNGETTFLSRSPALDSNQQGGGTDKPTITVEDLDISQLQPMNQNTQGGQAPRNAPKSTFYFYQASNGAHIYMHAVNVQMLVQEYGALENCPPIIVAKVVEKESVSMTEDLRLRLRYLRHLPVTCCFDVVEVSFRHPVVSKMTTAMFQEQIQYRQWKRNERAREEWKIEMRVRAEEDRMMGRSKAATNLKIESLRHFPSFGEDFPAGPSGEVNEGANTAGGGEVIGSEASTSPSSDVVTSSSVEGTTTGMSFAKMIREGQTRVQHSSSEPVNITRGVWPTLGGPASRPTELPSWNSGGTRSRRRVPQLSESSTNDGNCTEEEERNLAVPEFKHAFSDAVAKALDAAAKKSAAKAEENEDIGRRGKKKKKHKVLLFSSGGLN